MRILRLAFLALLLLVGATPVALAAPKPEVLAEEKLIALNLPKEGFRLLPAYRDRAAWKKLIRERKIKAKDYIKKAEAIYQNAPDPFPLEEYYAFSRTGDRTQFARKNDKMWNRLTILATAECLEGKGRFLNALAATIDSLCDAPTWVLSAHDGGLKNVQGKTVTIDLGSALVAWNMAEVLACFEDALPKATLDKGIATVRKFVITPYLTMADTGNYNNWWTYSNANWNPVCHSGVLGTALALPGLTLQERARIMASAKVMVRRYLSGFSDEGWTDEGIAYWNYGFGHFSLLCEEARRATNGKEDWLLQWEEARKPALTPPQTRLAGNVFPIFADCAMDTHADEDLDAWLRLRFGVPVSPVPSMKGRLDFPRSFLIDPAVLPKPPRARAEALPRRTWLPRAQILIERTPRLAFATMGNNNGVPHNHNDCGTFMVVLDGVPVLTDLGGEEYSRRTFTSGRYQSQLLNSFGHPVLAFASALQSDGSKYAAKVLNTTFTDRRDTLAFDLRDAYPRVPGLKVCTRTFTWEPKGKSAKLTVRDDVSLEAPQIFESALTTWGTCTQKGDTLTATYEGKTLTVRVTASAPWHLEEAIVKGKPMGKKWQKLTPRRYAVKLDNPAQDGWIQFEITN